MRKLGPLHALLAVLPLAACADLAETGYGGPLATQTVPASLAEEVGTDRALARLPAEAGAVVSVTQRRERDRLTQTVALAGDVGTRGSNRIRVVAAERDPSVVRRMTEERIAAELAAEMPGVDMRPIDRMTQGAGGPIGIASGRAPDGGACVYAWQETTAGGRSGGGSVFSASDDVDLSVRVRLCRRDLTEERLVALVEGLSLRGDVSPRRGFAGSGPTGVDALATAGYGGPAASSRGFEPIRPAASTTAPRPTVAAKPRAERPAVAAVPAPSKVAPSKVAPAKAEPARPAIVANPIPLPSGG